MMNHKVITPEEAYEDIRRINGEVGILLGNMRQLMPRAMIHSGAEDIIVTVVQAAIGNHIALLEDRNELRKELEEKDDEVCHELLRRRRTAMDRRKDL